MCKSLVKMLQRSLEMVWQMFMLVPPVSLEHFCLGRSFFPRFKPLGLQAEFGTRNPVLPMAGR